MLKTNMQTSSLKAFDGLKHSGKHASQAEIILMALDYGRDYTLREIKDLTQIQDLSSVSGRVNDLKKAGALIHADLKRNCTVTGKLVQPVMLPPKQLSLRG